MRKNILCMLLLTLAVASFGQLKELPSAEDVPDTNYLKKSKNQKAAGWLLTTAGATGLVITLISDATQAVAGGFTTILSLGTVEPKYKSHTAYYLLSAAGVGTGIAFFVASAKNKKKATALDASAFLKIERTMVMQSVSMRYQSYPSIAISVPLK